MHFCVEMSTTILHIPIPDSYDALQKLLHWAIRFPYVALLNPNSKQAYPNGTFPQALAVANEAIVLEPENYFNSLSEKLKAIPNNCYGYLGYDVKNELEDLSSNNEKLIDFPETAFFEAALEITFHEDELVVEGPLAGELYNEINEALFNYPEDVSPSFKVTDFKQYTSREHYIDTVKKLQQHILDGDIYEINYCIGFSAKTENFNAVEKYLALAQLSPTPFSTFLKIEAQYVLCASPERFLQHNHGRLTSQPIKGTAPRKADHHEDEAIKNWLFTNEKERAENMMIVDLVRNDLARSSEPGTVKVEELFGIYSFEQVHQMISTVSSQKRTNVSPVEAIKNAFPMGSMTGAPKIRAMQLIEQYENVRRNVFSGAIGYISPDGNFDFNVVIRSIFYDDKQQKLAYQVGSAITYDAIAEQEYEECLLKAEAIKKLLKKA